MEKLKVRDAMTHMVVTLRRDDKISDAAKRLLSNRISGAPVVENGQVVGVVSEVDLVRAYAPPSRRGSHFAAPHPVMFLGESTRGDVSGWTVEDVMTERVVSIGPDESILFAASLIDRHGVRRLPVIDESGYLIGVLARSDLVRCMARAYERAISEVGDETPPGTGRSRGSESLRLDS